MGTKSSQPKQENRPKRRYGEGSIYKAEGRDGYVASIRLPNGQRRKRSFTTRTAAKDWLAEVRQDARQGTLTAAQKQTVAQYLTAWLETAGVRLRTLVGYRQLINNHIIPVLGKRQLDRLTGDDLQNLYRQKEGMLSPRTIGHIHRVLHKALGDAVWRKRLRTNPADYARPPKAGKPQHNALTIEEARKVLKAAEGDRLEALYILALTTGMRQEELLGLKWDAVDLEAGTLEVRRTLFWLAGHGPVWDIPKTETSSRRVPLTPLAISALKAHRERQNQEREHWGERWTEQGLVFCNRYGGPIEAANLLYRNYHRLLERAEVKRVRFHDLRHSTASILLALNTHPKIVQELLGHSSIRVTMDTYSHAIPSLQSEAVNNLGNLLSDAPSE